MSEDSNNEYYLETPADVYGALRKIVTMQQPVNISIEGSDEAFHSAITHTNLKNSSFYMDQVVPTHGNDLIKSGQRAFIVADSQGVKIEFEMSGRLKYQPEREQYRAELPSKVLYLQRRTAYRVNIPTAHQILVKFKLDDDDGNARDLIGRLTDLSSSGFKAVFKQDIKHALQVQPHIPAARIRFNKEHHMDCGLKAHHIVATEQGHTQVGFAFALISGMGQRYIDRLIGELQWEERHQAAQRTTDQTVDTTRLP